MLEHLYTENTFYVNYDDLSSIFLRREKKPENKLKINVKKSAKWIRNFIPKSHYILGMYLRKVRRGRRGTGRNAYSLTFKIFNYIIKDAIKNLYY